MKVAEAGKATLSFTPPVKPSVRSPDAQYRSKELSEKQEYEDWWNSLELSSNDGTSIDQQSK